MKINDLIESNKNRISEIPKEFDMDLIYVLNKNVLIGVFDHSVIGAWETTYTMQEKWAKEYSKDLKVYSGLEYLRVKNSQ